MLIEYATKGDLSGVEVALSRGADVNATDSVSYLYYYNKNLTP